MDTHGYLKNSFLCIFEGTFEPTMNLRRHFSEIFFCAVSIELHLNHVLVFSLRNDSSTLLVTFLVLLLFQLSIFFLYHVLN